jgi:hypothetical protein
MSARFMVLALQCLLPIFERDPGEYLGISIANIDAQEQNYTITVTPATGTNAQTGQVKLAAGAQTAMMLNQVVSETPLTRAGFSGWIRIDSSASGCRNYLANGSSEFLAGTEADEAGGSNILLPYVYINTGFVELQYTETEILIVNAGSTAANVTAELMGLDGTVKGTLPLSVHANGSRNDRVSELFKDALPNNSLGGKTFEGYIRLSGSNPVSAWQRLVSPISRSMLRGTAPTSGVTSAMIPHFVFGGSYNSYLNIINPGSSGTSTIELNAYDDNGNRIGEPVQLMLRAGEGKRAHIGDLFRIVTIQTFPPPIVTGFISIRQTTAAPLFADIEIATVGGGGKSASMLYATGSSSTRLVMPLAVSSAPYFTGYAIANSIETLTVQNLVDVEVFDSAGTLVNRKVISLSPRTRQTGMVPPGLAGGYVRFTADFPIYVMGTIGSTDLTVLDQIPALAQ